MKGLVCIKCNEKILDSNYMLVAIERPYDNLVLHRECFNEIIKECNGWDGLGLYLAKNLEMWYNRREK